MGLSMSESIGAIPQRKNNKNPEEKYKDNSS